MGSALSASLFDEIYRGRSAALPACVSDALEALSLARHPVASDAGTAALDRSRQPLLL